MDEYKERLEEYRKLMSRYISVSKEKSGHPVVVSKADQEKIREIGASLLHDSESIAKQKRESIRRTIKVIDRLQLIQALFVGVGLLVFSALVLGKVIHPLKSLQDYAYRIGQGDFREIESPPQEQEIAEVYYALNRMTRDLRKREEDLLRSRHLASLGTLLAGVAHELNNPLSNIRSTCQILSDDMGKLDEDFQRISYSSIIEEVDKAGVIVRDLLELSRGKETSKEICNLRDLVKRTLSLLHGRITSNIEMVVNVSDEYMIFADRQGMLQALMNVISNAIDAIEGEGKIVIEAQNFVEGQVDLVISDTGSGIEEEALNRAFDPFFSTKDVGKGTGLGLFITHGILERNNGKIMLQSRSGKGTTCTLRLPIEEE
jgi:two-component system NtrC family sensor kinase